MIMKYNMITKKNISAIVGLVLFGLIIMGGHNLTMHADNNSIESRVSNNTSSIGTMTTDFTKIVELQSQDAALFIEVASTMSDLQEGLDKFDVANFEARLLMQENAIRNLSENKIDVPTHESTATDFNLVLLNSKSVVQDVYELNEVIYITGDAGSTVKTSISMKIRDNAGNLLLDTKFGILHEGRFTSIYMVPDLDSGIYTITISDGIIVDSITFEVR